MKEPTIFYTAVKGLVKNEKGEVLVLKQSDPTITGANQYHPPGGIVEDNESLAECVVREIEEELGVGATAERLFEVGEWQAERGDDVMQFKGHFFVCRLASQDFQLQSEEVSDIAWVGLDTIDDFAIMEPSKTIIRHFLQTS